MRRFKNGDRIRNVGAGSDTDSAYLCGQCVRNVISVQIQGRQYTEFCRAQEDFLKKGVGQHIFDHYFFPGFGISEFAPWAFADDFGPEFPFGQRISPVAEAAFRKLHDIAFVNQSHGWAFVVDGILNGFAHQSLGALP